MRSSLRSILLGSCLLALVAAAPAAPISLKVQPAIRHQTLEGFGCSINGWSRPLRDLFADDNFLRYVAGDLGLSVFRVQMWDGICSEELADWREIVEVTNAGDIRTSSPAANTVATAP